MAKPYSAGGAPSRSRLGISVLSPSTTPSSTSTSVASSSSRYYYNEPIVYRFTFLARTRYTSSVGQVED